MSWNDEMIKTLNDLKTQGYTNEEISEKIESKYNVKKSANAVSKTYIRYKDIASTDTDYIDNLRKRRSAQKRSASNAKETRAMLDFVEQQENIKRSLKELFKTVKFSKVKISKKTKNKNKKRKMTSEHMLTDLHYGKLTDKFNYKVARKRMKKLAQVTVDEFKRYESNYEIEKSIIYLGGDIIEGATIHGTESRVCSESGNPEQIRNAILSLYEDYLVPVLSYGNKVKIVAVTGNHDREGMKPTFNNPGKESFTWIIYNVLKQLCKAAGFTNVEWIIPEGVYHIENIYGSNVLYEHSDRVKGSGKTAYESHMAKRGTQNDVVISFFRIGHFHERMEFGRGRIIMNPSLAGQDSYAEVNGYNSEAAQTINYYVSTKEKRSPFYHSFCVYLDDGGE